jgi:hypothetical protein
MTTETALPFFARRKRVSTTQPRSVNDASRGRRLLQLWRRREVTTFQKCLAVHMYYASSRRGFK